MEAKMERTFIVVEKVGNRDIVEIVRCFLFVKLFEICEKKEQRRGERYVITL